MEKRNPIISTSKPNASVVIKNKVYYYVEIPLQLEFKDRHDRYPFIPMAVVSPLFVCI